MSQLLGLRYRIIQVLSQDKVGENYVLADIEKKNSTYYIFKKIFIHNSNERELIVLEILSQVKFAGAIAVLKLVID